MMNADELTLKSFLILCPQMGSQEQPRALEQPAAPTTVQSMSLNVHFLP